MAIGISILLKVISIEQQLAEKIHAFSLPREKRKNSRIKDIIDILLLIELKQIDKEILKKTVQKVFQIRGSHALPEVPPKPLSEWRFSYEALAQECGISLNLSQAYDKLSLFFKSLNLC